MGPWTAAITVAVFLSACGQSQKPAEPAGKANAAQKEKAPEAVPVETSVVERGPISAFLSFNSTLETEATVDLFPQIGGQVESLLVEEGDRVKAGDVLLKIEDSELRVELDESQINLRHLEESFGRIETLFRRDLLNKQEYDDKKFQLDQARLRVDRAKIRLDHATIRAPFDGVIASRDVQLGARVSSGTKLFSLVKLDEMIARVFVPGRYLPIVEDGQPAIIRSEFMPDRAFKGWVKRISPVIDPKSGTFKVTVGVTGEMGELAPGLFVDVQIVTDTRAAALLVPKSAIVYDGGERYVFAVVNGRAERRKLSVGFEDAQHVEALAGFEPGTPVIVLGHNGLKEGSLVRVVNSSTSAPDIALDAQSTTMVTPTKPTTPGS